MDESAVVLQAQIRKHNAHRAFGRQLSSWKKRKEVVQELAESESVYFSKMYLVCTVFLVPLSSKACSSESPFITMKQVRGLFSCVGAVKNVAEDMLAQLNREKDKNPNVCSKEHLENYQRFCATFSSLPDLLGRLKAHNDQFKAWLTDAESKPECQGEDLESLLARVVQRIPEYTMLIATLVKNTPHTHVDYNNLRIALSILTRMGMKLNEHVREYDSKQIVEKLTDQFSGFVGKLDEDHRRHLCNLPIKEYYECKQTYLKTKHAFLFSDLLVITLPQRGGRYFVLETWKLKNVTIHDAGKEYIFQLKHKSDIRKWEAVNTAEKTAFISSLQQALPKYKKTCKAPAGLAQEITENGANLAQEIFEKSSELRRLVIKHQTEKEKLSNQQPDSSKGTKFWASKIDVHGKQSKMRLDSFTIVIGKRFIYFVDLKYNVPDSYNLLDVQKISSDSYSEFAITFSDGKTISSIAGEADEIIKLIRRRYYRYLPGVRFSAINSELNLQFSSQTAVERSGKYLQWDIDVLPIERIEEDEDCYKNRGDKDKPKCSNRDKGCCAGFARAYKTMCHNFGQAPRLGILSEIEDVLGNRLGPQVFELDRFPKPINVDDIRVLLAALVYSPKFQEFRISALPHLKDTFPHVISMLGKATFITTVAITNLDLRESSILDLYKSMETNERLLLSHLDVSGINMEQKALMALKNLINSKRKTLAVFKIDNCVRQAFFKKHLTEVINNLQTCSNFRTLSIGNNHLSKNNVLALSALLGTADITVHEVNFSGVKVPKNYFFTAMEGLAEGNNWNLKSLDLSNFPMEQRTLVELKKFIRSSVTLKQLNLSASSLQVIEICEVISEIESNESLQDVFLMFKENDLGAKNSDVLGATLEKCVGRISALDISDNQFGDKGLTCLFKAIATTKIRRLYCNNNFREAKGSSKKAQQWRQDVCKALAALTEANTLQVLHMKGDGPKTTQLRGAMIPFLQALAITTTMKEVNIEGHQIGNAGLEWLAKAIFVNKKLRKVYWEGNDLTLEALEWLHKAIMETSHVIEFSIPVLEVLELRTNPEHVNAISMLRTRKHNFERYVHSKLLPASR